ncbi:hypothetical protein [Epilithonimonas arachidiradicis]|uniref:Uncharacterized protein n=1 Tax=Epilithonimonas arachidiradicis TaxID=1617282 RepID=A0A420DC25_9FLAO|nr:hypothetical protein [Epilithonimonas arachidiradicis]RKE88994.1 hypothetical protein BXY58_1128 [Epilithonimonas arachidiradicis]GGG53389.1 hypothetical protein GCM10007332_13840 [Epilithonimonas arachidiradicis]
MKKIILTSTILFSVLTITSFTTNKSTTTSINVSKIENNNLILAYVVTTNNIQIYFKQYECAQRYINDFGGTFTGTIYVKDSQAISCADLE